MEEREGDARVQQNLLDTDLLVQTLQSVQDRPLQEGLVNVPAGVSAAHKEQSQ